MYTNLLAKIKNAQAAKKDNVKAPFSKMDFAVAEVLARYGYLKGVEKKGRLPKRIIEAELKYDDGKGAISGVKLISKPSRHLYANYKDLKPVKHGHGLGLISTSRGVMATHEAKKQKLGGELLFEIW